MAKIYYYSRDSYTDLVNYVKSLQSGGNTSLDKAQIALIVREILDENPQEIDEAKINELIELAINQAQLTNQTARNELKNAIKSEFLAILNEKLATKMDKGEVTQVEISHLATKSEVAKELDKKLNKDELPNFDDFAYSKATSDEKFALKTSQESDKNELLAKINTKFDKDEAELKADKSEIARLDNLINNLQGGGATQLQDLEALKEKVALKLDTATAQSDYVKKAEMANILTYKGTAQSTAELENLKANAQTGDTYAILNQKNKSEFYIYNGAEFENIGSVGEIDEAKVNELITKANTAVKDEISQNITETKNELNATIEAVRNEMANSTNEAKVNELIDNKLTPLNTKLDEKLDKTAFNTDDFALKSDLDSKASKTDLASLATKNELNEKLNLTQTNAAIDAKIGDIDTLIDEKVSGKVDENLTSKETALITQTATKFLNTVYQINGVAGTYSTQNPPSEKIGLQSGFVWINTHSNEYFILKDSVNNTWQKVDLVPTLPTKKVKAVEVVLVNHSALYFVGTNKNYSTQTTIHMFDKDNYEYTFKSWGTWAQVLANVEWKNLVFTDYPTTCTNQGTAYPIIAPAAILKAYNNYGAQVFGVNNGITQLKVAGYQIGISKGLKSITQKVDLATNRVCDYRTYNPKDFLSNGNNTGKLTYQDYGQNTIFEYNGNNVFARRVRYEFFKPVEVANFVLKPTNTGLNANTRMIYFPYEMQIIFYLDDDSVLESGKIRIKDEFLPKIQQDGILKPTDDDYKYYADGAINLHLNADGTTKFNNLMFEKV